MRNKRKLELFEKYFNNFIERLPAELSYTKVKKEEYKAHITGNTRILMKMCYCKLSSPCKLYSNELVDVPFTVTILDNCFHLMLVKE